MNRTKHIAVKILIGDIKVLKSSGEHSRCQKLIVTNFQSSHNQLVY